VTTTVASQRSDEDVLRECLEELVANRLPAPPAPIAAVERKRSKYSSFYASDIITVRLASGDEFKVFLKDFGSYHHPKDSMEERREREIAVYRDLMDDAPLDTARYYGSVSDPAEHRFWLLLEYVEGVPVRHLEFERWMAPAEWLGRMYGYFLQHRGLWENCQVLVRHDASFFQAVAEQALRSITEYSPDLAHRLAPIVGRYDTAVAVMTRQPQTLVHGTYRPAQIITDDTRQPPRICPVDFEKAAIGASMYDLTFFVDGFDPPRLRRLFDAYREGAARYGVRVAEDAEMTHVLDCFRLHRVMNWLAVSLARRYEAKVIHKLVGMAQEIGPLVL
jgi:hypothetical protein